MSGPERPEAIADAAPSLKRKQLSDADQEDLVTLDHIFKRIRTAVPRAPYILSTPSLNPYHYHSQQEANAWMMGGLWRSDEESIQYRSYLYREPCQDCFELQAGEDDEPAPERPKSQASSTNTKKKMNLSAFKVKHANGTVTPGLKKGSPHLGPAKSGPPQPNGVVKSEQLPVAALTKVAKSPTRTPPDARGDHRAEKPRTHNPPSASQKPPAAKNEPTQPKVKADRPDSSSGTPHGLPPLLSPVDDPIGNPYGLPTILSPTLPSNIQEELDRLEKQRKRAESDASTSSSDRKSQALAVPIARPQKAEDTTKPGPRVRTVSVNGKSPINAPVGRPDESEPSLIVKFKFSKNRIPTVSQILRLPPKRRAIEKKERQDTAREVVIEGHIKPADKAVIKKKPIPKVAARRPPEAATSAPSKPAASSATTSAKPADKRPRADDDLSAGAPAKRQKAAATQDRPITPVQQANSSPAPSNESSAQKSHGQYLTPKRDVKSVNMLRTQSTESHDSTPGRSGTPSSTRQDQRAGPTSAPLTNKKQADIALLAQTSMKLNQMGRALKHEATKILSTPGGKISEQDRKRAAAASVECILSYMAAYYAQDLSLILRGRGPEVEQTWKTLLPLCHSYTQYTRAFPHLDGLRCYFSSAIAAAICTHVSARQTPAPVRPNPHDSPHADAGRQAPPSTPHTPAENFALLADHTIKMQRHFSDARSLLPFEDIMAIYKKTYVGREANNKLAKEQEKVSGARMSGPYFLPLGTDTSPIQAVRFGLRFLGEWCEKEGVEYSLRLTLDKPE